MIIDCKACPVRGRRCDDCAVTVLRGSGSARHLGSAEPGLTPELQLDAAERRVVSMFVSAGLVSSTAVARLCARRESAQAWETVREVG